MTTDRRLVLGLSIWPTGHHISGWRLPGKHTDTIFDVKFYHRQAQLLESGKLDFFFIGDILVSDYEKRHHDLGYVLRADPIVLASSVAAATEKIGIVATINTTYSLPFTTARQLATIDHFSNGRALVNIVTGSAENAAGNYGRDHHWDNTHRYEWTDEFVTAVHALWDSWEDGAVIARAETGDYADWSRVHRVDFKGKHVSVAGPLNVLRPPQGHIPILSAGRSEASRVFGAKFADIRFVNNWDFKRAQQSYRDLKDRLPAYGRNENEQLVLPGLAFFVADTTAEAYRLYNHVQGLVVEPTNWKKFAAKLGADLSAYPDDARVSDVPDLFLADGSAKPEVEIARRNYGEADPTLRQLFLSENRMGLHGVVVGSPKDIADHIEKWYLEKAADGFNLFPPFHPGSVEALVNEIVPELRRRGLYQKDYGPGTIRERFGFPPAPNVFVGQRSNWEAGAARAAA